MPNSLCALVSVPERRECVTMQHLGLTGTRSFEVTVQFVGVVEAEVVTHLSEPGG